MLRTSYLYRARVSVEEDGASSEEAWAEKLEVNQDFDQGDRDHMSGFSDMEHG